MDMSAGALKLEAGIAARLERLPMTGYQRSLFGIIATAWFFDSMDLGLMTFVLGSIKAEFGLSAAQAGLLASSSFLGMFLGAAIAGLLADRFGRKPVFQVSMIFWGVGSLMCGLADNVTSLMIYRVLLGFGMGMEFPIGLSMVSEIVPAKSRGKYVAILEGFWPIGFIAAGALTYLLLPVIGWRGIFIALAVPAVFVFVVRRMVPESPRWLEDVGRKSEADTVMAGIEQRVERASGRPLPAVSATFGGTQATSRKARFMELWSGPYARRTVMLWSVWFFALLGYYGLTTWLGALLQQAGYAVTKSVLYTVYISLAGIPGFIFSAWLLEKWGRKPTCALMLIGSAVAAYAYGQAAVHRLPVEQLIAAGLCMQFFLFGMWSVLYAYTPELYPTRSRATGSGFASSVGRIGSLAGPYLVGVLLPVAGQGGVFTLGALSFAVAAAVVLLLGVETRGKALEEVSH
ncbi:putative transporter, Major facilitator superfamily (MFS_1) [Cupriavidus taiwanensis]|uniref:MFS transporter n=1 Tax=Cupriavidus taiwanensis TaxID=164546 RepID=UPI000E193A74|nr:MFS transporter [Cupriavidus taiwanensis]SOZ18406.1 putative transporter, Major facilitator superfamily (MFS_1) [Cupriavidus taiwanensis]SOZ31478.1 putative transporter, Major facilitator superfamily (MFS_1) [Cupriavidus taiwanensis]SOZ47440.1 putative transporter, Major facilitator superfamily (MFS_1) [Cupriavidus taiwanensis]